MYVGGIRIRLIQDNLRNHIEEGLRQLGWFEPNRNHLPVTVIDEPIHWAEEAAPNLVSLTMEHVDGEEVELGSNLTENRWEFFVDVYGEKESLSLHLSTDIKDILTGRFPSIGYTRPSIDVYDLTLATPSKIFRCDIEDVQMDKSRTDAKPFRHSWWMISFTVVDEYGDENR